jgi:hypothetical protein
MTATAAFLLALLPQADEVDLLERLVDPAWLLQAPLPGEAVEERTWVSSAENRTWTVAGAGVVASVWADPPSGRLLFLRPDDDTPVLAWDLGAAAFDRSAFPAPLGERVGNGWACMVPVAFRDGLRLVHQPDPAVPSTVAITVRSMPTSEGLPALEAARASPQRHRALQRVAARLVRGEVVAAETSGFKAGSVAFQGNASADAPDAGEFHWGFRGHGIVRWLTFRLLPGELPASFDEILRGLVLRVESGSHERFVAGQVLFEAPLADFLGNGLDPRVSGGARCDWDERTRTFRMRLPMRFRDGMKIVLRSPWRDAVPVRMDAGAQAIADPADLPPLTLHAGFIQGAGGALPRLQVDGPARLAGWTVSTRGRTPAANHYTSAAAFAQAIDRPRPGRFRAMPVDSGFGALGEEVVVRWYGLDAPVAADALDLDLGVGFADDARWEALAWWYAVPGTPVRWGDAAQAVAPSDVDASLGMAAPLPVGPFKARRPQPPTPAAPSAESAGVLEAECLDVASMAEGTREEGRVGNDWSGQRWLWWSGADAAQLNLKFPVERPGAYRVHARFATGGEFGRVQVLVDGRALGEPIDCRTALPRDPLGGQPADESDGAAAPGPRIQLGTLRLLPRRDHTLSLRALDGTPIGLDFLRLEAVKPSVADEQR